MANRFGFSLPSHLNRDKVIGIFTNINPKYVYIRCRYPVKSSLHPKKIAKAKGIAGTKIACVPLQKCNAKAWVLVAA